MVEKVSAAASIQGVMSRVGVVGKTGTNQQQHYAFRGIDAVINAVGPALREVGGFITPEVLRVKRERGVSKSGTPTVDTFVKVRYSWFGSDGVDPVVSVVEGEATDTSDKSTAKAMSVAFRTFLIQVLCLPTGQPDPDEDFIERAPVSRPAAKKAPAKTPSVAGKKWAGDILDATEQAALRKVWDAAEAAGELGCVFGPDERKYVEQIAALYGLPTPPTSVTVGKLIGVVRSAIERLDAAADAAVEVAPVVETPVVDVASEVAEK